MGAPDTAAPGLATPRGPRKRSIRGLSPDERRAQRREDLLTAAFELIARDGYPNTSIEQICQTASVATRAFYELFDGKEDCYLSLLREVSERIEHQVVAAMQQAAGEDERETIRRVLTAFAHALVDDPRVAVVTFGTAAGISPRIEAQRLANRRWAAAFVEAFWRRNQAADVKPHQLDYHALAVATVGGLFEAVTDWLHQADPPRQRDIDKLIADLTTFVLVVEAGIVARGHTDRPETPWLATGPGTAP